MGWGGPVPGASVEELSEVTAGRLCYLSPGTQNNPGGFDSLPGLDKDVRLIERRVLYA